ncbi:hypothetical protein K3495_g8176 [Podosphaera aphanis]|nr:hypothetical protein K3495_g8176 [Podosphaera aphanis]
MSNQSILRITRELSDLKKSSDLSLVVACEDDDVRNLRAMIIGPPDTPYEFGFFEFSMKFDGGYPGKAPEVTSRTTNGGKCRFNPNIYSSGKVCLSILGTWRGESGEQWSSAQGLESILISIQSLMSSNPYENEPGFENANSARDKQNKLDYIAKIRHESLRISVIQRLEKYLGITPTGKVIKKKDSSEDLFEPSTRSEPFEDICKRKFLWYYDSYLLAISKAKSEVHDGQSFVRMPFEFNSNQMQGIFNYTELERRLKFIRKVIIEEIDHWAAEGLILFKNEATVAVNIQSQYRQIVEAYKSDNSVTLDIELVDSNPFIWSLTYFGRPMTNLDGGLFRIKLYFSPRFPEEQPRVVFETELFHYRITSDGVPCYITKGDEDIKSHVQAIISILNDESTPYDPRTLVNPLAAKLFWGSETDKKLYYRKLRRSVQKTLE